MSKVNWWVKVIRKPEYFLQPHRITARIWKWLTNFDYTGFQTVRLPWGFDLEVNSEEVVGWSITKSGVHDLSVSEVLWRLQEPEDVVLDVGANIGYMTSIMVYRTGKGGSVYAFEPHPLLFQKLKANINRWQRENIFPYEMALSSNNKKGLLYEPTNFAVNQGRASLNESENSNSTILSKHEIPLVRLDNWYKNDQIIGVMKVDVENHELQVFQGSEALLKAQQIRDIIFEDHETYPTPVTSYLERFGYTIFKLDKGLFGPIARLANAHLQHYSFDSPSFLATTQPERVHARLKSWGWYCLMSSKLKDLK